MGDRLTYQDYARYARLSLDELERNCRVEAFRAHGPGGQGVNTADSAVRMTHEPTGIVVVSRESRSQFRNRKICLQKIAAIIAQRARPPRLRKTTVASPQARRARLEAKRHRSHIKQTRKPPSADE